MDEKALDLSSLSLTLRPSLSKFSAFFPLTVTWHPISSFLLIEKALMVYLAFEVIGFCPVKLVIF